MKLYKWHEDNEFWGKMAAKLFSESHWKSAPKEIEQIISLIGITPGSTILDLCCGPGRHSMELARRGFNVTGMDITSAYLEKAKKDAEKEGLSIEFVQEDMRNFKRPDTFHGIIMMYTSFGYFEDPDENRQVLVNACQSLKDGCSLIIDVIGKEILARIFREREWYEKDGVLYLEERKVSKNWSWIENRWIMIKGKVRHEFRLSHWLYSASELSTLLKDSGFSSVRILGDFEGSSYDHKADRLVVIARK